MLSLSILYFVRSLFYIDLFCPIPNGFVCPTLINHVLCSFDRIASLFMTSSYEILSLYDIFLFSQVFFFNALQIWMLLYYRVPLLQAFLLNVLVFLNIFFLLSFYLEYKYKITFAKTVLVDIRFWIMSDKAKNHFRLSAGHVLENWLFRKMTYWVIQKWIISTMHFCSFSSKGKLIFL